MADITQAQIIAQLLATEPNLVGVAHDLDESHIALLEPLLTNSDERVRANAFTLLSLISPHAFLRAAQIGTGDSSPLVRMQIAASYQNLSEGELLSADSGLLRLLEDSDRGVRKFAIKSGGRSRSAAIVEKLTSMSVTEPETFLRTEALGAIGPPR